MKKGNWIKWAAVCAVGGATFLVVAYLVLTSGGFLRSVVLPKVGTAVGGKLTARDLQVSPFSSFIARGVRFETTGAEPVLELEELDLRYSLTSILSGKPQVESLRIRNPKVHVVQNADGTGNLVPIQKALGASKAEATPSPSKAGAPLNVSIGTVSIEGGQVYFQKKDATGNAVLRVEGIKLGVDGVRNGQKSRLSLAAGVRVDRTMAGSPAPTSSQLEARLENNLEVAFDEALVPGGVVGSLKASIAKATGDFVKLADSGLGLTIDLTPTELKTLALSLQRGTLERRILKASGPLSLKTLDSKLALEIGPLDRELLNLAGGASGLDFRKTMVKADLVVESANAGKRTSIQGTFRADQFGVGRGALLTPEMNLSLAVQVVANADDQSLLVQRLEVEAVDAGRKVLSSSLLRPMNLGGGESAASFRESSLELSLDRFDLGAWKPFLGDAVQGGAVSTKLKLDAKQGGKGLGGSFAAGVENLSVRAGETSLKGVDAELKSNFQIDGLASLVGGGGNIGITLDGGRLDLSHQKQPVVSGRFFGALLPGGKGTSLQSDLEVQLAPAASMLGRTELEISAGSLKAGLQMKGEALSTNIQARLSLAGFSGKGPGFAAEKYGVAVDLDAELKAAAVSVRNGTIKFKLDTEPAGELEYSGNYSAGDGSGRAEVRLRGLNQHAGAPFLRGSDGLPLLSSMNASGSIGVTFGTGGAGGVTGRLEVTNVVPRLGGEAGRVQPLDGFVAWDLALKDQVLDIQRVRCGLSPTARATNVIELSGKVDLRTNATAASQLTLRSEGLDATPLMDLMDALGAKKVAASPVRTSVDPVVKPSEAAGGATRSPMPKFDVDVQVNRVFAREVVLSNLVAKLKTDKTMASLEPLSVVCNGAPIQVQGRFDLSKPEPAYELKLAATKIPLEPFANSFSPAYKGQAQGELIAVADLKGVGLGGAALRKSLQGRGTLSFTNANIQLVGPKAKLILTPILTVLRMPELLESPLNGFDARVEAADGKVQVQTVELRTEVFHARTQGVIPLSDVLTNSPLNLPVTLSLRRAIAQKANLVPANAPAGSAFVDLPLFATVKGTVGQPEVQKDLAVIGGLGLKSLVGLPVVAGEKAGSILQGVGNLLTGEKSNARTNLAGAKTNAPAKVNPLDLLKLLPDKKEKKP